ncbi:ATP-binding protein [Rheinheimera sp.]|uniref:sensor histidine kinase n=1 Tax=Rheinheimera sp. TaxID=1869214 RepID=UPI00307FB572
MALPRLKTTLGQRLWLLNCLALALVLALLWWFGTGWWLLVVLLAGWGLFGVGQYLVLKPLQDELQALNLHAQNLQDGSFNVDANRERLNELQPLADVLQQMSAQLRQERATLYQRELLLDTVLQSSPSALLLTDASGRLLMTNPAARALFNPGRKAEGLLLAQVLAGWPALLQAIQSGQQGLIHLGEPASIWHLSISLFQLNQKPHQLYLLKPMTREIHREEIKAWKKLLRVIGHELNNTLAPLSSMAFSGEQLARHYQDDRLQQIFQTMAERSRHLNQFLQSYIEFAKLPAPQRDSVNWPRLINQLQEQYEFELVGDLPKQDWQLDAVQLTQLLLNLLKNAHESGSATEQIELWLDERPSNLSLCLQDAGGGLSADKLSHAMVPFFTTKAGGSGIGLTLCRDIAEGHGGTLELNNQGAGLRVTVTFPAAGNLQRTEAS